MTIYKKRPPAEPVFRARRYEGNGAESFLGFLGSGATCTITNQGYGMLRHEVRLMAGGELVEVKKGEWVVYSEDHDVRVMSDDDFREEFVPEAGEAIQSSEDARIKAER